MPGWWFLPRNLGVVFKYGSKCNREELNAAVMIIAVSGPNLPSRLTSNITYTVKIRSVTSCHNDNEFQKNATAEYLHVVTNSCCAAVFKAKTSKEQNKTKF